MSNEISENLLEQAKQQLISGEFENAAKSSRGVLALDESNIEAADILKAATAALGSQGAEQGGMSPYDEELKTKVNLRRLAADVQKALDAKQMFEATKLIETYLAEFPNMPDAVKMLADVKKAHADLNTQREKQWQQNQTRTGARIPTAQRAGASSVYDEVGCLNWGLSFMLGGILGLVIQYVTRRQGWTGVKINAVIFVIAILLIIVLGSSS